LIVDLSTIILSDPQRIIWTIEIGNRDIICASALGQTVAKRVINRLGLGAHIESITTTIPPQGLINDPEHFSKTIPLHELRQVKKALTKAVY